MRRERDGHQIKKGIKRVSRVIVIQLIVVYCAGIKNQITQEERAHVDSCPQRKTTQ